MSRPQIGTISDFRLEKILEDQHTVIDMLEHDLEQARKTTFPPLENFLTAEQFTNLLDLDGNVPPDYFALPPVTSKFYSALFTDPATEAAKRAALSTEQRLRECKRLYQIIPLLCSPCE